MYQGDGKVFVSWRLLGTDPDDIAFNLYRSRTTRRRFASTKEPLTTATSFRGHRRRSGKGGELFRPPRR